MDILKLLGRRQALFDADVTKSTVIGVSNGYDLIMESVNSATAVVGKFLISGGSAISTADIEHPASGDNVLLISDGVDVSTEDVNHVPHAERAPDE